MLGRQQARAIHADKDLKTALSLDQVCLSCSPKKPPAPQPPSGRHAVDSCSARRRCNCRWQLRRSQAASGDGRRRAGAACASPALSCGWPSACWPGLLRSDCLPVGAQLFSRWSDSAIRCCCPDEGVLHRCPRCSRRRHRCWCVVAAAAAGVPMAALPTAEPISREACCWSVLWAAHPPARGSGTQAAVRHRWALLAAVRRPATAGALACRAAAAAAQALRQGPRWVVVLLPVVVLRCCSDWRCSYGAAWRRALHIWMQHRATGPVPLVTAQLMRASASCKFIGKDSNAVCC